MKFHIYEMFSKKDFEYVNDAGSDNKIYMETQSHKNFHERLRKTLYYGKYTDGSLPSGSVTDVAVKLINSRTGGRKALDKCHAARLTRRARISPCALMMGILYTERLAQSNPGYLKKVSSSDLFLVSMLVASKYLYDDGEEEDAYNYDWSRAGNCHVSDLNRLEREFLNSIDWRVFVSSNEFFQFVNRIETRIALDQGSERGWFSYLDMRTLLENLMFQELLKRYVKNTGKVILCCTLAYSLSVALLLSTPAIIHSCYEQHTRISIEKEPALLPTMSFVGHIGQSEHVAVISVSIRERHSRYHIGTDIGKHDHISCSLKSNCSQQAAQFRKTTGCRDFNTNSSCKASETSATKDARQTGAKCTSGALCSGTMVLNKTNVEISEDFSSDNVFSFMSLTFNQSWVYGRVKFPVWENSYSGILIGFSTSSAAAAA